MSIEVEPGATTGDFLQGFFRGTRKALYESGRKSLTLSIPEVTPFHLGLLIALFERAVSFYASLININAYHQPGVEAGKKAAGDFLETLNKVRAHFTATAKTAAVARYRADPEDVYHCLTHLAANGEARATLGSNPGRRYFPTLTSQWAHLSTAASKAITAMACGCGGNSPASGCSR